MLFVVLGTLVYLAPGVVILHLKNIGSIALNPHFSRLYFLYTRFNARTVLWRESRLGGMTCHVDFA